jgi:hypothetical protein
MFGTVNLFGHAQNRLHSRVGRPHGSSRCSEDAADLGPCAKGLCPECSILGGRSVIPAETEEVVDLVSL